MNGSHDVWKPPRPKDDETAVLAARAAELLNPQSASRLLLVCEHAGVEVPAPWRSLGLDACLFSSHFGGDIGADALVRAMARDFQLPVALARYSRLFLDYNRMPDDWCCIRPDIGGIPIPGNLDIDADERSMREAIARRPLEELIERGVASRRAMISIHTFTPVFDGIRRPWDIGVLWRDDERFAYLARRALERTAAGARIGDNQPYDLRGVETFTLQRHAFSRQLPAIALEIRNDLLRRPADIERLAGALGSALVDCIDEYLVSLDE